MIQQWQNYLIKLQKDKKGQEIKRFKNCFNKD